MRRGRHILGARREMRGRATNARARGECKRAWHMRAHAANASARVRMRAHAANARGRGTCKRVPRILRARQTRGHAANASVCGECERTGRTRARGAHARARVTCERVPRMLARAAMRGRATNASARGECEGVRTGLTDSSQRLALARRICWTDLARGPDRTHEFGKNLPVVPHKGLWQWLCSRFGFAPRPEAERCAQARL
jgi:hypothetical protein